MVLRAEMIAEHRGHAHGKSNVQSSQKELRIDHDGDGGHSVLSRQLHHNPIEQKGGDSCGRLADQLRTSIGAAFSQYSDVKGRLSEPEPSPVSQKKDGSGGRGDEIANSCAQGRSGDSHMKLSHKHKV